MFAAAAPNDLLVTYGPLGVGVVVLGSVANLMFRRLLTENDELKAQREQMVSTLLEVVPLMKRSTEIHEKRQASDEITKTELDEVKRLIVDLRSELGLKS